MQSALDAELPDACQHPTHPSGMWRAEIGSGLRVGDLRKECSRSMEARSHFTIEVCPSVPFAAWSSGCIRCDRKERAGNRCNSGQEATPAERRPVRF